MTNLAGLLIALVGPLAKQALFALGIGLITYVGLDAAVTSALSAAKSSLGQLPAAAMAICARGGMFTAFSIVAGGITARMSMMIVKRLGRVV